MVLCNMELINENNSKSLIYLETKQYDRGILFEYHGAAVSLRIQFRSLVL